MPLLQVAELSLNRKTFPCRSDSCQFSRFTGGKSPNPRRPFRTRSIGHPTEANIIKSKTKKLIPQLKGAIQELQAKGFKVPDFPDEPQTEEEKNIRANYAKVLGSAVNPVLSGRKSDRRVANRLRNMPKKSSLHGYGDWSSDSKSHVAHMKSGDFYGSELTLLTPTDSKNREFVEYAAGDDSSKGKPFSLQVKSLMPQL